jgi:hypothetical protein
MAKQKISRKAIVDQEIAYLETEVKSAILSGDCHELKIPEDGRFLCMGGPIGPQSVFLVVRTNKGDVILTMNHDHLAIFADQVGDLVDDAYAECERDKEQELQRRMIQPPSSIEVH